MDLLNSSRYKLSLIGASLFSIGLIMVMLVSGTSSAAAASKRPPTRTPTPVIIPTTTATSVPNPPPNLPGTWKVVDSPNLNVDTNILRSVAVVSSDDVWAVGYGLIEHWNGARWRLVSAAPGGNAPDFKSVTAVASNDVWAVGRRQETTSQGYQKTLVEHWDGSAWTVVPSPNGSTTTSQLLGVDAVSANDIWAVGDTSAPAPTYVQSLIEHWDGSSWSIIPSPSVSGGSWNALTSVAVVSANDVWAVGYYMESNWSTLTMHWDGSTWSIVPSPNGGPYGNYLYSVSARSTNDVWAVGASNNGGNSLILHWDGTSWSVVPSPNIPDWTNQLQSVTAVAADDVWAVGVAHFTWYISDGDPITSSQTIIQHWNGTAWSIVPSPNPGDGNNYYGTITNELYGVAAVSASDVWAVGMYGKSDGLNVTNQTLVERYTVP
jgi:hypothetical protein